MFENTKNATKEQFAILAVEAITPKGIGAFVNWNGGIPTFAFRVRYMHNGTKKSIGTFTDLDKAVQALAAARASDTLKELHSDWREVVAQSLQTLADLRTPDSFKDQMMQIQFGSSSAIASILTQEEQDKLYELVGYIAPHTLQHGKPAEYVDEETGEVSKIPAHIVTKYLDNLEAELMRIKYAPSGDDLPPSGPVANDYSPGNQFPDSDADSDL